MVMSAASAASLAGRRVVVLAGPTAVGKSALALRLCEVLSGELVSVDSVQVYRGLEIGANKPTADEMRRVPHHLVDVRDPLDEYTAGAFYVDALRAIEQVLSRGRTPVLVGGTSMYMRWLTGGRPGAPRSDPEVAARAQRLLAPHEAAGDWPTALAELRALDAARADALSRNDWYRLHRQLTVALQTRDAADGAAPAPAAPAEFAEEAAANEAADAVRASLDLRCFFLHAPRVPLCRRIDARCEAMVDRGLLEEVADQLLARRLLPSSPAGRAIGYRQALQYLLRDGYKPNDEAAAREFVEGFAAASRRYAAQQVKWFRSEPGFEWVEAGELAEARVLARSRCGRGEWEEGLAAEAQAAARAVRTDEQKAMRTYIAALPLATEPAARAALVARADACCERLQPVRDELLGADAALAKGTSQVVGGGDDGLAAAALEALGDDE